ncbi:MAG: arsenate reductase ArsC [Oscillochloris sp.]|nr:arsenate reductase ArsC [Oscillochloris sp.]
MATRVLILCTGNSARSQMAEGLLRHLGGDSFDVYSAGSAPSIVNPMAITAMAERGIDISAQRSKHLNEFLHQPFDYVITVCDNAAESCPLFPGRATRLHWSFPDPAAVEDPAERMNAFRSVREGLATRFQEWMATNP